MSTPSASPVSRSQPTPEELDSIARSGTTRELLPVGPELNIEGGSDTKGATRLVNAPGNVKSATASEVFDYFSARFATQVQ